MKRLTLAAIILLLSAPVLADIDEASEATRSDIFAVRAAGHVGNTSAVGYIAPFNTRLSFMVANAALRSETHKQAYIDYEYRHQIRPHAARDLTIPEGVVDFYPFAI